MWGGVLWGVPSGSGAGSFSLISGFASPSASGSPAGLLASGQQTEEGHMEGCQGSLGGQDTLLWPELGHT